jgi:hypothetical protein
MVWGQEQYSLTELTNARDPEPTELLHMGRVAYEVRRPKLCQRLQRA